MLKEIGTLEIRERKKNKEISTNMETIRVLCLSVQISSKDLIKTRPEICLTRTISATDTGMSLEMALIGIWGQVRVVLSATVREI